MEKTISIIVPVYNDRAKIGNTIEQLIKFFNTENLNGEIIIISDGGHDNSSQVVQNKINQHPKLIRLINRQINKGKGYTVREGIKIAQGDFIFYTDADLPYLTYPIKEMLILLRTGVADMILASRDLEQTQDEKPGWLRQLTHIIYSHFVRALIPIPFSDTLAGLKGMTRHVATTILPRLTIERFSFDVELLLVAIKYNFRIYELPVSLKNVGRSNLNIRRDAPIMIKEIIKIWYQLKQGYYN